MRHLGPMIRLLVRLHRAVLVAAIALSLVATGFGHRLPTATDEAALAFALEFGITPGELCGGDPDSLAHPGAECQACQITCAADLPPLTGARIDLMLAVHSAVVVPQTDRATRRTLDPAHRPQGPPVA